MCGDIPEMAHYVDAVTREDQTPWYELKVGLELIRKKQQKFLSVAISDML